MKGAIGLIVIALVVWGFWMSWEWLRKPKQKKQNKNANNH
ncbi:hypothetical protein TMP139_360067 [Tenacibaculum maritimum]|nr:hypothetical protein TMP139_360067 [Tenacibaculum maritimum]